MDELALAKVIHVVAVVLWIGGVAMVTTVIFPAVKRMSSREDQIKTFEQIEGRFAAQARITTLLTGLTGFYMLYRMDAWSRYLDYRYWWIHAMTLVWIFFTLMLFVLEPFVLHKVFKKKVAENPERTFKFMHRLHWVLLILSLITIIGAVAGGHGWYFFG